MLAKISKLWLLLPALAAGPAFGQDPVCSRFATLPEGAPRQVVTLDLAVPVQTSGRTKFAAGETVGVHLINLNPFAYEFRIDNSTVILAEGDLARFLALLPLSALGLAAPEAEQPAGEETADQETPSSARAAPRDLTEKAKRQCTDLEVERASQAIFGFADLKALWNQVNKNLKAAAQTIDNAETTLESQQGSLRIASSCQAIRDQARLLQDTLGGAAGNLAGDLRSIEAGIERYQAAVKGQAEEVDRFADALWDLNCSPSIVRREVEKVEATIAGYEAHLAAAQKDAEKIEETITELGAEKARLQGILNDPDRFNYFFVVTGPDDPAEHTISIFRKASGAADFPAIPYLKVVLGFGGRPRFALTAGFAFPFLDTDRYKPVKGFALDEEGQIVTAPPEGKPDDPAQPVLGTVVGKADDPENRVALMAALHVRLWEGFFGRESRLFSGTHWTIAMSGKPSDSQFDVEFLTGPTFSFVSERAFLTLGLYNGRTETLKKGFYEGRLLPSEVETEVPVEKTRNWGAAVALSLRVGN